LYLHARGCGRGEEELRGLRDGGEGLREKVRGILRRRRRTKKDNGWRRCDSLLLLPLSVSLIHEYSYGEIPHDADFRKFKWQHAKIVI